MQKIGRNDPCPCGSGHKYKHCCLNRPDRATLKARILMAIALLVLASGLALALFYQPDDSPRRVWSPEHGHWHDVP